MFRVELEIRYAGPGGRKPYLLATNSETLERAIFVTATRLLTLMYATRGEKLLDRTLLATLHGEVCQWGS